MKGRLLDAHTSYSKHYKNANNDLTIPAFTRRDKSSNEIKLNYRPITPHTRHSPPQRE